MSHSDYYKNFQLLNDSYHKDPYPALLSRIEGLKRLQKSILRNRKEIQKALFDDLGKSEFEADATEIFIAIRELNDAIRNLRYWIQSKSVSTDILLFGTSSYIRYEPRGVVIIISPWNYPFNLIMSPFIASYSAGNKIILKPSEIAVNTSSILVKIMKECFQENEVQIIEGDHHVAAQLCKLPVQMIFFTGSVQNAKKVLREASDNLTQCTLELGGKCPVIIDRNVDIKSKIADVAFAKILNSGQTCLAPDFIVLPREMKDEFVQSWNQWIADKFQNDILNSDDYAKIINQNHYKRLKSYLQLALSHGAHIENELIENVEQLKMAPIVLSNVDWENPIMEEEIFGPILPIITYNEESEIIPSLQLMNRPLSLYIFSKRNSFIEGIIQAVPSGGVTVNQCILNYAESNLPFGGNQHSGMGRYHGYYGFQEFSHTRSVSRKGLLPSTLRLFHPPYNSIKKRMIDILIKLYS